MVDGSQNSRKNGKPSTSKTSKLTAAQALEIAQQALIECEAHGMKVQFSPATDENGQPWVIVLLANTQVINGNLVLVTGKEDPVTGKEEG